jgi:hypothetical protein
MTAPPYRYVSVEGPVVSEEELDPSGRLAMARRYLGARAVTVTSRISRTLGAQLHQHTRLPPPRSPDRGSWSHLFWVSAPNRGGLPLTAGTGTQHAVYRAWSRFSS